MENDKPTSGITIDTETTDWNGKNKIIIVDYGSDDKHLALIETIKKKFGDDLIIVNSEKELERVKKDFNISKEEEIKGVELKQDLLSETKETFILENYRPMPMLDMPIADGKERRNKRREQERNKNKRKY